MDDFEASKKPRLSAPQDFVVSMQRVFTDPTATAFLNKGIFPDVDLLQTCRDDIVGQLQEKPEITVFGKKCHQQRNIGFFSDFSKGYTYSRKLMRSLPFTESMKDLLTMINTALGAEFNGILVNEYLDGNDYISAHSDDEIGLDQVGVVSISFGAERTFRIRDKRTKDIVHEEVTTHCSILHMGGTFQNLYTHEIPRQPTITGPRLSFTFRKHIS